MEKTTKAYRKDGSYLNVNDHQLKFLSKGGFSLKNPKSKAKPKAKVEVVLDEDKQESEGDQEAE